MILLIDTGDAEYQLYPRPEEGLPDTLIAEDGAYTLRLRLSAEGAELAGCHLFLGDVDMDAGRYECAGQLSWPWQVRDYVGELTVAVERAGDQPPLPACEIVVDPNRSKLTRSQFAAMVNDISAEAAVAYSLSPATHQLALGQRRQALNLAQLEYIRQRMLPLRRAVEAIARRPRRALVDEEQVLDLARAQAPDDRSITWVLRHAAELVPVPARQSVPAGARHLHARLNDHLPLRLQVSRRRSTYAVYENRLIQHFLRRLNTVLRHTQERLAENVVDWKLDDPIRRLAGRRLQETGRHRQSVNGLLALDFLAEVSPLRRLRPATSVLRKDPLYARFYRLYREFERAVTPFDGDPFRLSLEKVWQLYEYWCFFQVVAALRLLAGNALQFDASAFMKAHADRISLAMGEAEVQVSQHVTVHFQKTYGYRGGADLGSYSHAMRPDISIELRDASGQVAGIVLLDPKYRVNSQSLNQAMDDLHRYKDAIVGPGRQRLVKAALALCPGGDSESHRYFDSTYIRQEGLGAIVLKPGQADAAAQLAASLQALVLAPWFGGGLGGD